MVADFQFIPQLAEYFVDINGITPPTSPGQGWLIDVGGVKQAHGLMGVSVILSTSFIGLGWG